MLRSPATLFNPKKCGHYGQLSIAASIHVTDIFSKSIFLFLNGKMLINDLMTLNNFFTYSDKPAHNPLHTESENYFCQDFRRFHLEQGLKASNEVE